MKITFKTLLLLIAFVFQGFAQQIKWSKDGNSYTQISNNEIVQIDLPSNQSKTLLSKALLTPTGKKEALEVADYFFSEDGQKALIYTNTQRVWRYETRGDYWVLDLNTKKINQIGVGRPESSLMFAKLSPNGKKVAYVSEHNLYVEDVTSQLITPLTQDGTARLINGTFDWAYEEEFDCRDGFRWSSDSKNIAYWQIDANKIRNFLMINTTDSIYSHNVPVEYPKVGETPSPAKIGVVNIDNQKTTWAKIEGDPQNHYLPRMEWAANDKELVVQQLNRKQNESKTWLCNAKTGESKVIHQEKDDAWIDVKARWHDDADGWEWIAKGKEYLWMSEKDGWRHLYRVDRTGKENLITKGNYDVITLKLIDEANSLVYFLASPSNATQKYLYKVAIDGKTDAVLVSPKELEGTHNYNISPNGKFAQHTFSNHVYGSNFNELIDLQTHTALKESESIKAKIGKTNPKSKKVSFFQVTTSEGITLDGWLLKPTNFDSTKKYPVVFFVYTEPAATTANDNANAGENRLYVGDMAKDGYIYISLDGRGTPAPKGRAWRKAIYRKIGIINIKDQALATKEILKWKFIDSSRVAVHGWSGGGSTTLNLLFQYPEIYKTGIAVAAVANQLTYDNIYQERYMGIPQENKADFVQGSPITHAKNLQGKLLYIHGTGDDNVHYQNAEMLLNELIKHNKQFQFMAYPNRSHGIREGEGTTKHLSTLFTNFLKENCPPGGRAVNF